MTRIQFGNPDGTRKDVTGFFAGDGILGYEPEQGDDVAAWRIPSSITYTTRLMFKPQITCNILGMTIVGTLHRCSTCRANPTFVDGKLLPGWNMTFHRAPSPLGSHLPTDEPIYLTPHKPGCTGDIMPLRTEQP